MSSSLIMRRRIITGSMTLILCIGVLAGNSGALWSVVVCLFRSPRTLLLTFDVHASLADTILTTRHVVHGSEVGDVNAEDSYAGVVMRRD
jgi:hypothetical protein